MDHLIVVKGSVATGSGLVWSTETTGEDAVKDQRVSMPLDESASPTPYRFFGMRITEALSTLRNW